MLRQQSVASLSRILKQKDPPNDRTNLKDHLFNELVHTEELTNQRNLLTSLKARERQSINGADQYGGSDPQYFNSVLISKLACLKILQHALRGGNIEVMGMLVGSTIDNQFVVFDCYELPVEGTETRVNAQSESYEYMVQYMSEMIPDTHNIVGWYHSHPGYDCWLSNIDMHTQDLNQNYQDPYLAIVVDPLKSLQYKKLSIGAFRTFHVPSETRNEDPDNTLQFYDLNLSVFDSDLNAPLDTLKLTFEFPRFDANADTILLQGLVGIFSEWNTSSQMNKKSLAKINTSNDFFFGDQKELVASETSPGVQRSRQIGIYQRPTRSSSFVSENTSTNDDSDVDMDDQQLEDLESINSSVHTLTEPTSPYRRPTQLVLSAPGRPGFHAMPLIFNSQKESKSKSDNQIEETKDRTLKSHFYNYKKALLDLKLEEYKKLRFLRDTFTLDGSVR